MKEVERIFEHRIRQQIEVDDMQFGFMKGKGTTDAIFTARRSNASAVLGVLILSVCHTRALWLIQRTYRRYFYTIWKDNPCSQMWFFVQLCSSWHDFNWLKASRGPSAIAELLVILNNRKIGQLQMTYGVVVEWSDCWTCDHKVTGCAQLYTHICLCY